MTDLQTNYFNNRTLPQKIIARLRNTWLRIYIDFWWAVFDLRKAQYGDIEFGEITRRREHEQWRLRLYYLQNAPGPFHAGFNWERRSK